MPTRRTAADRLAELQAKKSKADARLAALEAQLKDRKNKDDIRRQIILGGLTLKEAAINPEIKAFVQDIIRRDVKKPEQLVLFADILKDDVS